MESENSKEFDRRIRGKLDSYHPEVPSSLWKAVEAGLPHVEKANISGRRSFPYSWLTIAACLLIAFSFWKLQPEEVIHLRATSAIAEKPDDSDLENVNNSLTPIPAVKSAPRALPATESKQSADTHAETAPPDRRSAVPPNSYATNHRSGSAPRQDRSELHQRFHPVENPESVMITEPELQTVVEEQAAPVSRPIEEAIVTNLSDSGENTLSAEERSRPKVVSSVLNFIASNIHIGGSGTRVEFSENEHGVLKVDFKGFFNKNNQGL